MIPRLVRFCIGLCCFDIPPPSLSPGLGILDKCSLIMRFFTLTPRNEPDGFMCLAHIDSIACVQMWSMNSGADVCGWFALYVHTWKNPDRCRSTHPSLDKQDRFLALSKLMQLPIVFQGQPDATGLTSSRAVSDAALLGPARVVALPLPSTTKDVHYTHMQWLLLLSSMHTTCPGILSLSRAWTVSVYQVLRY